jgi:hypothetical protein
VESQSMSTILKIGMLAASTVIMSFPSSRAVAITAEVAKECRELALKEHPRRGVGTAYAAAERQTYQECVAKHESKDKKQ